MRRTIGDIVEGIRAQPAGVAISLSAIAIGIASLTVLMAVMGGLRDRADQMIDELGVNVIAIINQAEATETNKTGLRVQHASLLEHNNCTPIQCAHIGYKYLPYGRCDGQFIC
jgi:ABC-type lipoprotein release transport system permease subunit